MKDDGLARSGVVGGAASRNWLASEGRRIAVEASLRRGQRRGGGGAKSVSLMARRVGAGWCVDAQEWYPAAARCSWRNGGSSVISRRWMMMGRRVAERKSWERKMSGAQGDDARRVGCRCQAVSSGLRAKPGGSGVDRRFVARFKRCLGRTWRETGGAGGSACWCNRPGLGTIARRGWFPPSRGASHS